MYPDSDRLDMIQMIPHTIRNAMLVANGGGNKSAYIYRYRGGEIHVVIVGDDKGQVDEQYVVTQYPLDTSKPQSNLRIAKRNGYTDTGMKTKTRPGKPGSLPVSAPKQPAPESGKTTNEQRADPQ